MTTRPTRGYGFPIDFVIEGSLDGGTWQTVKTMTNHNGGQPLAKPTTPQTFEVAGRYRHVRVRATKPQAGCSGEKVPKHFQLAELQVESDDNVALRATADGETSIESLGWFERFVNDGVDSSSGESHG